MSSRVDIDCGQCTWLRVDGGMFWIHRSLERDTAHTDVHPQLLERCQRHGRALVQSWLDRAVIDLVRSISVVAPWFSRTRPYSLCWSHFVRDSGAGHLLSLRQHKHKTTRSSCPATSRHLGLVLCLCGAVECTQAHEHMGCLAVCLSMARRRGANNACLDDGCSSVKEIHHLHDSFKRIVRIRSWYRHMRSLVASHKLDTDPWRTSDLLPSDARRIWVCASPPKRNGILRRA